MSPTRAAVRSLPAPSLRNAPLPVPAATYLFRAAVCHLRARLSNQSVIGKTCDALYPGDVVTAMIARSTSGPATTTDSSWAGPLARRVVSSLLQEIVSISAAADLLVRALRLNFDRAGVILLPGRQLADPNTASWIAEGAPIPVKDYTTNLLSLRPHKLASITTYTQEMARSSNIEEMTRSLISESAALALDAALFSTTAETAIVPGGILAGVAPISSANGTDKHENLVEDIEKLVAAIAANKGGSSPVFITDPAHAAAAKAWLSPLFDYPILASTALASGTLICVEARSLAATVVDSTPDFATAESAVLHNEDAAPADIVSGGTPSSPSRSLFQTDGIALKMTISNISWMMRAAHVSWTQAVNW
jgi:hypothetical protein